MSELLPGHPSLQTIWVPDEDRTNCKICSRRFHSFRRKHHCRVCGEVICRRCSGSRLYIYNDFEPVRICNECCPDFMEMNEMTYKRLHPPSLESKRNSLPSSSSMKRDHFFQINHFDYITLGVIYLVSGVKSISPFQLILFVSIIKVLHVWGWKLFSKVAFQHNTLYTKKNFKYP